ncbi:hypothetical protein QFC24_006906 [Naganishia onofrii]|uniref:Uncharacterized protein n=1 Tax=Naganishia onofrii TaxID=1851511 RepID=A0ACC2WWB1_9TREE|nr:hypothetical protein QFC24_006906 [Naganishia onofrii]
MNCEPPSQNITASITSLPEAEHEHIAGVSALSGVNLMDTFRSLPNNPSYASATPTSVNHGTQPKPHQFQPHFPVTKPSAKKAHIIPNSTAIRPKGKICVFGKNDHSRLFHIFSNDTDVAQEQLKWLIAQGYSRQVELYPSQPNDVLEENIRNEFGARAPPGRLDLVKFRGSTMELNQDTWPIHSLANGSVSLAAYFRGCKHAFLFTNEWRNPPSFMKDLEEEFMTGWYVATKEANMRIHGHFDIDDDEYMKEFLNLRAIKDAGVVSTSTPGQQPEHTPPEYTSLDPFDDVFSPGIDDGYASPVSVSGYPSRLKATVESDESGDEADITSTINGWLKPAPVASTSQLPMSKVVPADFREGKMRGYQSQSDDSDDIDQEAKFKLGQRIQKAILFSTQGYHHFKKAKMDFDALLGYSGTHKHKLHATSTTAVEAKPTKEQLGVAASSYPKKRLKWVRSQDRDGQALSSPRSVIEIDSSDPETAVQVKPEAEAEKKHDPPVMTDSLPHDAPAPALTQKGKTPKRKGHRPATTPLTEQPTEASPSNAEVDVVTLSTGLPSMLEHSQINSGRDIPYTGGFSSTFLTSRCFKMY